MHPILLAAAAAALLAPALAAAQSPNSSPAATCAIIADYRAAEAAYGRKDFGAAAAQFRPLAEQGLGPAQTRLGQMAAAGQGGPADPVEAYRWLALAAAVNAPGAKEALAGLKVTPEQRAQAKVDPAKWQPAKLGPCLDGDPRIKRPDGATGYNFERVINHVLKAPSATGSEKRRLDWLMGNLEKVRLASPRHLIYFKALHGIAFAGNGPFVVIESRDNLPMLVVNETYTDTVSDSQLKDLTSAALVAVHRALVPVTVASATETYKGRTIRYTPTDQGRKFLATMKQAIDMADQLPPDLAKLAHALTDLRFEPREAYDKRGGAVSLGSYSHDAATGRGYMSYSEMFETMGPSRLAINLVDSGIYVRRDAERAETQRQLDDAKKRNNAGDVAKAEARVAEVKKKHDGVKGDCELEDVEIKTMEALKFDQNTITKAYRQRERRGCS
jgi:hypothetical protein